MAPQATIMNITMNLMIIVEVVRPTQHHKANGLPSRALTKEEKKILPVTLTMILTMAMRIMDRKEENLTTKSIGTEPHLKQPLTLPLMNLIIIVNTTKIPIIHQESIRKHNKKMVRGDNNTQGNLAARQAVARKSTKIRRAMEPLTKHNNTQAIKSPLGWIALNTITTMRSITMNTTMNISN